MIYIRNESQDPAYNLALEEFLVKTDIEPYASSDIAILWQNQSTVVVGRNQNTAHEINRALATEKGIQVVRRLSGGGAVYHDLGNLNFSIILRNAYNKKGDFRFFTQPLSNALAKLGMKTEFSGRNDVELEGAKFSGNAQYSFKDSLLHHGTILYDSDLSQLVSILKPKKQTKLNIEKLRGVSSVKRSVTNLARHTEASLEDIKRALAAELMGSEDYEVHELRADEKTYVESLAQEKYRSDLWTWGRSPQYSEVYEERFESANIMLALSVEQGVIKEFDLYGDFFEKQAVTDYCAQFIGINREYLPEHIASKNIEDYLLSVGNAELLHLLGDENRVS